MSQPRPPAVSLLRFAGAILLGAAAGLPGALCAFRPDFAVRTDPWALVPVALACAVLPTLCSANPASRRDAPCGILLLVPFLIERLFVTDSFLRGSSTLYCLIPWVIVLPPRNDTSRYPHLYRNLRHAGFLAVSAAIAFSPAAAGKAGGLLVGLQALIVAVFLGCALRTPAALAELRSGYRANPWAGGLLGIAIFLAVVPGFGTTRGVGGWLERLFNGQVPWHQSWGCLTWTAALALACVSLIAALVSAAREHGFAALSEEFLVLTTAAALALVAADLAPWACLPVAAQIFVFCRWVLTGLAWPTLLLHFAPGLALGSAALFARFLAPSPTAWLLWGALLGAAYAIAAVHLGLLRTLAGALIAGRRWSTAYAVCAGVAAETGDLDAAVRAADCARHLGRHAVAAHHYEQAGLVARAGAAWLAAARQRLRPSRR